MLVNKHLTLVVGFCSVGIIGAGDYGYDNDEYNNIAWLMLMLKFHKLFIDITQLCI